MFLYNIIDRRKSKRVAEGERDHEGIFGLTEYNDIQFAIFAAYNSLLETEFFFNEGGTLLYDQKNDQTLHQTNEISIQLSRANGSTKKNLSSDNKFEVGTKVLAPKISSVSPYVEFPISKDVQEIIELQKKKLQTEDYEDKSILKLEDDILNPLRHQNISILLTKHANISRKKEHVDFSNIEHSNRQFCDPQIVRIDYYSDVNQNMVC